MAWKKETASSTIASRSSGVYSGKSLLSGSARSARLPTRSHWPAKSSASARDFGSASIRRTWSASTPGSWSRPASARSDSSRVGHRRPEEVRQPAGQLVVGDAIRALDVGPVALEEIEELGRDQDGPQGEPDGGLEAVAARLGAAEQPHQPLDLVGVDRPAERAPGERGDAAPGGLFLREARARAGPRCTATGRPSSSTSAAAARYFSMRIGGTNRVEALLSNPAPPPPSAGKASAGWVSTPSRSRIVLLYCRRVSRWIRLGPGSLDALDRVEDGPDRGRRVLAIVHVRAGPVARRRHGPLDQGIDHLEPQLGIAAERLLVRELRQVDVALGFLPAVAAQAVLLERAAGRSGRSRRPLPRLEEPGSAAPRPRGVSTVWWWLGSWRGSRSEWGGLSGRGLRTDCRLRSRVASVSDNRNAYRTGFPRPRHHGSTEESVLITKDG